ncbi:DUF397 domain-containing protein [Actinomadura scrupuli]|uniref:DUF397 domain-containing protein n=1 Tax=Actinomadura scrupuli TaxID=559629 RepID=UPI003D97A7A2
MPPIWRKSTYSGDPSIGTCVEVAAIGDTRAIRDSKNPNGPKLSFSVRDLRGLITSIKHNELEL